MNESERRSELPPEEQPRQQGPAKRFSKKRLALALGATAAFAPAIYHEATKPVDPNVAKENAEFEQQSRDRKVGIRAASRDIEMMLEAGLLLRKGGVRIYQAKGTNEEFSDELYAAKMALGLKNMGGRYDKTAVETVLGKYPTIGLEFVDDKQ